MKAFAIHRYGRKEVGRLCDLPEPRVGDDDVLIQVHAASVNPLDARIRTGEFRLILPYRLPLILGNDLAGTVLRVGARVQRFRPGDAVYARAAASRIGTFAQFIAVPQDAVALKPRNLGMVEAAALPLVALTAWQMLVDVAKLQPGQKVFIHAGSGGVGSIAIQLAKHLGAFVATTTSTANVQWVKALGADVVIDYKKQSFETALRDYDVVLHSLDKDALRRSLQVLGPGGQLVTISGPPTPDLADTLHLSWPLRQALCWMSHGIRKQARQRGVSYHFVFMHESGAQLREIAALVEAGKIRPVVDKVFALEATAQALACVETGRARGKVVIQVQ